MGDLLQSIHKLFCCCTKELLFKHCILSRHCKSRNYILYLMLMNITVGKKGSGSKNSSNEEAKKAIPDTIESHPTGKRKCRERAPLFRPQSQWQQKNSGKTVQKIIGFLLIGGYCKRAVSQQLAEGKDMEEIEI